MITFRTDSDFYVSARRLIQGNEDFIQEVYSDSSYLPSIGYGYALIFKTTDKKTGAVNYEINGDIPTDFATIGVTWGEPEEIKLKDIRDDLDNGLFAAAKRKPLNLTPWCRTSPRLKLRYFISASSIARWWTSITSSGACWEIPMARHFGPRWGVPQRKRVARPSRSL